MSTYSDEEFINDHPEVKEIVLDVITSSYNKFRFGDYFLISIIIIIIVFLIYKLKKIYNQL